VTRPTDHNVVATFENMTKARRAMEDLGDAGIEAEDVSLVGAEVEAAAADPDTRMRDMEVTAEVGKKAILSGAAGSALGAIAGAAAFAIPGIGPAIGTGIWAAAAAGAMAGGAVGGMVGGVSSLDLNENWELTFQDAIRGGKALVAVHAHDDPEAQKAEEALARSDPEKIEHLDSDGHQLSTSGANERQAPSGAG
jgi:outer membrane lipoprotein SlyB